MEKLYVTNPEKIKFTLEITMTLEDWKKLGEKLPSDYIGNRILYPITDMVCQAGKEFYPENNIEE